MSNKIIRTICVFSPHAGDKDVEKLQELKSKAENYGYDVQTLRVCTPVTDFGKLSKFVTDHGVMSSMGTVEFGWLRNNLGEFLATPVGVNANIELAKTQITRSHVDLMFEIFHQNAKKSFDFTFVFNNEPNSPYMPSASYQQDGFAVGLQPTNLSKDCSQLNQWLANMQSSWNEIDNIFSAYRDFLGIDASIAPLGRGEGSLVKVLESLGIEFNKSFTTTTYRQITEFIKENNPRPVGLNGLMLPALEDFHLSDHYEKGEFSIERNIFVSLHCGLGIDTYPIGLDEDPTRVLEILRLMQSLSNKYQKPLSVRFVNDGKAKIGQQTDFKNQYLKDVTLLAL